MPMVVKLDLMSAAVAERIETSIAACPELAVAWNQLGADCKRQLRSDWARHVADVILQCIPQRVRAGIVFKL